MSISAQNENADILCITEHWLTENVCEIVSIENYIIVSYFCRKYYKHGGVLLAVNKRWNATKIDQIAHFSKEKDIELAGAIITNINTIAIAIYRSPKANMEYFINKLTELIHWTTETYPGKQIIVSGDFNINFLTLNKESQTLTNLMLEYGFKSMGYEPSRYCKTAANLIDNIFINTRPCTYEFFTKELHLSDHQAQILKLPISTHSQNYTYKRYAHRKITPDKLTLLKQKLDSNNWLNFFESKNANEAYTAFQNLLENLLDEYIPLQISKNHDKNRIKWVDKELVEMRKQLEALDIIKRVRKEDSEAKRAYNSFKIIYNDKIEEVRKKKNENIISQATNKQKAIANLIKRECKSSNTHTTNKLTADEFNSYFANVGKNISYKMGDTSETPQSLLEKTRAACSTTFYVFDCTKEEVYKIIRRMKLKKSMDIYNMNTEIIKVLEREICEPITLIINKCLSEETFPNELKCAKVIPIYKKIGNREECERYRPISILPVLSKIFETLLKNRITNFLEKNKLLNDHQHGYRKHKSTTTALLAAFEKISNALDDKKLISMLNLDLSKAFDAVPHDILMNKLFHYGFRGRIYNIMKAYLTNRHQIVSWNGSLSSKLEISHGVPQGSILGPILFIIYINDLQVNQALLQTLYCDDTSFLISVESKNELKTKTDEILKEADIWFTTNKLKCNIEKTEEIAFSARGDHSIKFLGINIDSQLNWNKHIEESSKKISKGLGIMKRIKRLSTKNVIKMTYYMHVHSLLSYGILIWGSSSATNKILKLQKKAIRILCDLNSTESCRTAFKNEKILTVYGIYILECLKHIHSNPEKYKKNSHTSSIMTRNGSSYQTPLHKKMATQQFVDYWGTKCFNKLPEEIKSKQTKPFIQCCKRLLINGVFYNLQEFFSCENFEF